MYISCGSLSIVQNSKNSKTVIKTENKEREKKRKIEKSGKRKAGTRNREQQATGMQCNLNAINNDEQSLMKKLMNWRLRMESRDEKPRK